MLIAAADDLLEMFTPYQVPANITIPTFSLQRFFVDKFMNKDLPTFVELPALKKVTDTISACIGCPPVDIAIGPAFRAPSLEEAPSLVLYFRGKEKETWCLAEVNSLTTSRAQQMLSNTSQNVSAAPFWQRWGVHTDSSSCRSSLRVLAQLAQHEYRDDWSKDTLIGLGITPPGWNIANDCLAGFQQV